MKRRAESAQASLARLSWHEPPSGPREYILAPGIVVVLGREAANDIALVHAEISRRHAAVTGTHG